MKRASLSKTACALRKMAYILILCAAVLLCSCGEQRDGMLSIASEDVPFIYAIADINSVPFLIVANMEGYYREYEITGASPPSTSDVMCVSRSGRVHLSDTTNWRIFTSSGADYSSWSYQQMTVNILDLVSTPFGDYCMQDDSLDLLYRYNEGSNSWASMGKQITNAPEKLCYSSTYYKLYVTDNSGGNTQINELGIPAVLAPIATYPIGIDRIFLAEASGGIYIGNNAAGLYRDGALIGSGSALVSYAVVSPAEIFASNSTLPLQLFRLVNSTFVPELQLAAVAGTAKLWPMPPDHIIIGVSGMINGYGLYVYNFKKRNLRILNAQPIIAVYARQQ